MQVPKMDADSHNPMSLQHSKLQTLQLGRLAVETAATPTKSTSSGLKASSLANLEVLTRLGRFLFV